MMPELVDRRTFRQLRESYEQEGNGIYLDIAYDETLPDVALDKVDRAFERKGGHADVMSYFDGRWHFLGSEDGYVFHFRAGARRSTEMRTINGG